MGFISNATDWLVSSVEGVGGLVNSMLKGTVGDYYEPETADEKNLITKDSALCAGFEVAGIREIVGAPEFETLLHQLTSGLGSVLKDTGSTMEICFQRDPEGAKDVLEEALRPAYDTTQNLRLNASHMLDARIERLSKFVARETCTIGLWTTRHVLAKDEAKAAAKVQKYQNKGLPEIRKTRQPIGTVIRTLRDRHNSSADALQQTLKAASLEARRLNAKEMLRVTRAAFDLEQGNCAQWNPCLPGDPIPRMAPPNGKALDASDMMYPALAAQVFTSDIDAINAHTYRVGGRLYSTIAMEIPQRTIMPFQPLFDKMREAGLPFRAMFRIIGGGYQGFAARKAVGSLLAWTGGNNRLIHESLEDMQQESLHRAFVRYQFTFTTWAPEHEEDLFQTRRTRLMQFVQGWGDPELRYTAGDPKELLFDSLPFARHMGCTNMGGAPLEDVMRMTPITRPSTPWRFGSVLFRTPDGKLMPFDSGSSKQTTWAYMLAAMPGLGKSVTLANLVLGTLMEGGLKRLPQAAFIDIGPSSKNTVELLKSMLPKDLQHLVNHWRMSMTTAYAVNVFDTPVGLRFPTPEQKQFLVNFLTLLATPPEQENPFSSMSSLVNKVIDRMYLEASDDSRGNPTPYRRNTVAQVDAILDEHPEFVIERNTSWWHIVDFLFANGHVHESMLAQRYAVPKLTDAITAVRHPAVASTANFRVETQELGSDAFVRLIQDSLERYPVLSQPTVFDLGESRITSIDIEEVAKSVGSAAKRQTTVMYLYARYIMTSKYRTVKESFSEVPNPYREFHKERVAGIREDKKWIILDEFHRTSASPVVQDEVLLDLREGRKWNIGVIMSSQDTNDFPEKILNFTSGRFFLGANNPAHAEQLQKQFGFNDSAREMLIEYCHGPTKVGAPFLAQFQTVTGMFTQLMYLTLSPLEAWALSTTATDVLIREHVVAVLGRKEGLARLGRAYENSASEAIEDIKRAQSLLPMNERAEAKPPILIIVEQILQSKPIYEIYREGSVTELAIQKSLDEARLRAEIVQLEREEKEAKEERIKERLLHEVTE